MSAFSTQIKTYVDSFGLSRRDAALLTAHYPLFRLAHEAEYATGWRRSVTRGLARLTQEWTLSHQIPGPRGSVTVTIRFASSDLASFREVFWGLAYPAMLSEASTFVDIGANTGMAACFFCTQYDLDRILVVEANPFLTKTLRANMNGLPAKVSIEMVAVADADGVMDFTVHYNHRHSGFGIEDGIVRQVTTRTLRTLLDEQALTEVDILKMDVEGAEHRVLAHDPAILSRVRCLLMETHQGRAERDQLAQLVEAQGFSVNVDRGAEVDSLTAVRLTDAAGRAAR